MLTSLGAYFATAAIPPIVNAEICRSTCRCTQWLGLWGVGLAAFLVTAALAGRGGVADLERLVAGPHTTSGTGYASVDRAFDLDRLRGISTAPERATCWAATDAQPFRFCGTSPTTTGTLGLPANSSSRSPASCRFCRRRIATVRPELPARQ
jgi:hypothetical protein